MVKKSRYKRLEALTLVELVIVVAIIAFVAAGGLVTLQNGPETKLENEIMKVVSDLRWAQAQAVSQHKPMIVVFDIANDAYEIYETSVASNNLHRYKKLAVDLKAVTPPPAQLTFDFILGTTQTKQISLAVGAVPPQIITVYGETGYISY